MSGELLHLRSITILYVDKTFFENRPNGFLSLVFRPDAEVQFNYGTIVNESTLLLCLYPLEKFQNFSKRYIYLKNVKGFSTLFPNFFLTRVTREQQLLFCVSVAAS